MASIRYLKHVCDRCGETVEVDDETIASIAIFYPGDWQHVTLGQTGASLDLCPICNKMLNSFLKQLNASGMDEACFNKREVL